MDDHTDDLIGGSLSRIAHTRETLERSRALLRDLQRIGSVDLESLQVTLRAVGECRESLDQRSDAAQWDR